VCFSEHFHCMFLFFYLSGGLGGNEEFPLEEISKREESGKYFIEIDKGIQ